MVSLFHWQSGAGLEAAFIISSHDSYKIPKGMQCMSMSRMTTVHPVGVQDCCLSSPSCCGNLIVRSSLVFTQSRSITLLVNHRVAYKMQIHTTKKTTRNYEITFNSRPLQAGLSFAGILQRHPEKIKRITEDHDDRGPTSEAGTRKSKEGSATGKQQNKKNNNCMRVYGPKTVMLDAS
jgi:hypothetical protein